MKDRDKYGQSRIKSLTHAGIEIEKRRDKERKRHRER